VDDSAFRTEISVGEGQVLLIDEGSAAAVSGNDGVVRAGRVAAVSAGSDGSSGSYTVVVEWVPEEGDRLKSGMSVDVTIEINGKDSRVIIPASAMRLRGGNYYVFVEKDGIAEAREITTGSRLGDRVEVISGLEDGEILLTSGLASLTPGIPVTVTVVGESGDA
jgi:membrane fusion protein (multidrug efflux system)